jgi:hypothetical protein
MILGKGLKGKCAQGTIQRASGPRTQRHTPRGSVASLAKPGSLVHAIRRVPVRAR